MYGRAKLTRRRLAVVTSLIGIAAAVTPALGATASGSSSSNNNHHLVVHVMPTNHGPLPACHQDGSNCTAANATQPYIYVENENPLTNVGGDESDPAKFLRR